jgi:hypothetical protein
LCFTRISRILIKSLEATNQALESEVVALVVNTACQGSASDEPTVVISGPTSDSLNLSDNAVRLLEGCRQYRLLIANEVIGPELLGCTPDAARKVWSRAIHQLRRELGEHESMP